MTAAKKPLPLYAQVKRHLAARMAKGEWRDGARLPSEHELMARFNASRMTVHRALREMSADGLLRRVQGVGTFMVRDEPRSALLEVADIADDIARRGHVHRARVITLDAVQADAVTGAALGHRPGARLLHSAVVHLEDDVPVQLEERFVAPKFAPLYLRQDFCATSTARYLASLAPATEVEHVIHAGGADEQVRRLLEIGAGEHCLRLTRRTWTVDGPATFSIMTHPGSRYSLGSRYMVANAAFSARRRNGG